MARNVLKLSLRAACVAALLVWIGGCAEETTHSTLPPAEKVQPPDRTLVHRFAASPDYVESGRGDRPQTAEEARVGRALADALARNLVEELKRNGINAALAREGAPPEDKTMSITGQFMHIEQGGSSNLVVGFTFTDRLRTRMLIFQGSKGFVQFVAQADTATQLGLKRGLAPAQEKAAVEADGARAAKDAAEKIVNHYRQRSWIKPR